MEPISTHGTLQNYPSKLKKKNESMQWSKTYCIKKNQIPTVSFFKVYNSIPLYQQKNHNFLGISPPRKKTIHPKKPLNKTAFRVFLFSRFFFFRGQVISFATKLVWRDRRWSWWHLAARCGVVRGRGSHHHAWRIIPVSKWLITHG